MGDKYFNSKYTAAQIESFLDDLNAKNYVPVIDPVTKHWKVNNVDTGILAEGTNGTNGINGVDGINGTNGTNGTDGADGVGVPEGGSAGQILAKNSENDYDTKWVDPPTGSGSQGSSGQDGVNGKSAYDIAVDNGFEGTEEQWLASLKGADGTNGTNGTDGTNGKSAYEIALDNGFVGTEEQWLDSLKGTDGTNGTNGADGVNYSAIHSTTEQEVGVWTDGRKLYQKTIEFDCADSSAEQTVLSFSNSESVKLVISSLFKNSKGHIVSSTWNGTIFWDFIISNAQISVKRMTNDSNWQSGVSFIAEIQYIKTTEPIPQEE